MTPRFHPWSTSQGSCCSLQASQSGWFALGLGLVRMFAAGRYQRSTATTSATVFLLLEGVLLVIGLVLTFNAYRPGRK